MQSSMKIKASLIVFLAVLACAYILSLLFYHTQSASLTPVATEKRGKPQAPVFLASSPIISVDPHKPFSSDIELVVNASNVLIEQITLNPSAGLLLDSQTPVSIKVNADKAKLPVKFLPTENGRYYLHVNITVKSNNSAEQLDISSKALAVIVQVGSVVQPEVKLQKLSSGENLEVLPAQEN